jgi:hypothetical protein
MYNLGRLLIGIGAARDYLQQASRTQPPRWRCVQFNASEVARAD